MSAIAIQNLLDYYRVPATFFGGMEATPAPTGSCGFFRFGPSNICYGRSRAGVAQNLSDSSRFDAAKAVGRNGTGINFPFHFPEVIDNLRLERYRGGVAAGRKALAANGPARRLYYSIREALPVWVRRQLQKFYLRDWKSLPFPAWPVDLTVDNLHEEFLRLMMEDLGVTRAPFIWFWPDGAPNCLIMTHDVETSAGRDFTRSLIELDASYGFRSSFQVIPEKRYDVPDSYVADIRSRGCEFNVHDLNHDGHLYLERGEFLRRAAKINSYARRYNSRGFRSGSMYRNQEWYEAFECSYDMSVPNVAHLEPMQGGCCTIMPYFVGRIVELPLTTAQDYSLFNILNDYSIDLWKQQLAVIGKRHGLMSFITHPDYLIARRARKVYESLLDHLRQRIGLEGIWAALPGEVDQWWRERSQMQLTRRGNAWEIAGPGRERARLAYAVLVDGRLAYEFA